jgi:hypothetical protein
MQSASEMFPSAKKTYKALSRMPTEEENNKLYGWLKDYGKFTGLCWLMSPEPVNQLRLPIPSIREIIYSKVFLETQGQKEQIQYILTQTKIDENMAVTISRLTVGQRDNPLWHHARNGRLTASNFGVVLNAKRATPSLIKRLLGEYDASRAKAVVWGVNNENEAVKSFSNQTGLPVEETGIWLHPSGLLGASPDGLVGKNHLIEVKCPYSARASTIADAVDNIKDFCLSRNSKTATSYTLRRKHVYWHQVQGQLHITGCEFCYFVVWATKDMAILNIRKDGSWAANLDLLRDFYLLHIFPKIIEGEL